MGDTLYIVMPAYNEEENIENVIREWYPVIQEHDGGGLSKLVIVNDGSKDSTFEKANALTKEMPQLVVLDKPNSGHGSTVLYSYEHALNNNADYIFQTDSDGQTLPSEFNQFWDNREKYAAVIGWRNSREDGVSRVFVTKVLKLVLLIIFGTNVPDANAPYRLIKREVLEEYLPDIPKDFNLSNVMLSVSLLYNNENVKYIPITFRPRQGGVNSINLPKIFGIGKRAVSDFRTIKCNMTKHEKPIVPIAK